VHNQADFLFPLPLVIIDKMVYLNAQLVRQSAYMNHENCFHQLPWLLPLGQALAIVPLALKMLR